MNQANKLLNSLSVTLPNSVESHIIINRDRFITVPEELMKLVVQYDHDIETVTFDCPRYWDEHDLSTMRIYVNYMRPDGSLGAYLCENIIVEDDVIHFDWTISGHVTEFQGRLSILVCIKDVNLEGTEIHRWNSELNTDIIISEGLECREHIFHHYPDIITQLLARMENTEVINKKWREKTDQDLTQWKESTEADLETHKQANETWKQNVDQDLTQWKESTEQDLTAHKQANEQWKTGVDQDLTQWKESTEADLETHKQANEDWKTGVDQDLTEWKESTEADLETHKQANETWKQNVDQDLTEWKESTEETNNQWKDETKTYLTDYLEANEQTALGYMSKSKIYSEEAAKSASEASGYASDANAAKEEAVNSAQIASEKVDDLTVTLDNLTSVTVPLQADNWSSTAPYTQTVAVEGMSEEWVPGHPVKHTNQDSATDQKELKEASKINRIVSSDGSLTFYCYKSKPTMDITLDIPRIIGRGYPVDLEDPTVIWSGDYGDLSNKPDLTKYALDTAVNTNTADIKEIQDSIFSNVTWTYTTLATSIPNTTNTKIASFTVPETGYYFVEFNYRFTLTSGKLFSIKLDTVESLPYQVSAYGDAMTFLGNGSYCCVDLKHIFKLGAGTTYYVYCYHSHGSTLNITDVNWRSAFKIK